MRSLKSKASRFFKDGPSRDEQAAEASTNQGVDFDAGIEGGLKKKPSPFFRSKHEKALPAPPSGEVSGSSNTSVATKYFDTYNDAAVVGTLESASADPNEPLSAHS
ncbi:hypothetical protein N0V94_007837, partial [Neodidymelliopsis sp. IMI 364377]